MIILTGGAGFIGSCFLQKLNSEGINDIIIVDSLADSSKWHNLLGKKFYRYFQKSAFLMNFQPIIESFNKEIDAIIHLGACTKTTEKNVDYLVSNNFDYSIALAEFARDNHIRFIYASSAATYGNGECGYDDEIYDPLRPLNPYGYSKHIFDEWVISENLNKRFTGLKFFNVYGPNEYHKDSMASMIFKAYNQVVSTKKIRLFRSYNPEYADGEQMRDFIYVKDVVDVIWNIYSDKSIKGIYNLGTGKARTWNDLAFAVFNSLKIRKNIEYIDMPAELINQYQYFTEANMTKFFETFPDYRFTSLEDGINDYITNYLSTNNKYL